MNDTPPPGRRKGSSGQPGIAAATASVAASASRDELVASRDDADARAADRARHDLRERGIVPIEPDGRIGVMLVPGEQVMAVRRNVGLDRPDPLPCPCPARSVSGDLYVTTSRLVHLGNVPITIPLVEIREAVVATGALRLLVGRGRGVELRVRDPQVLRVEIAAGREAARDQRLDEAPAGRPLAPH